jgi:hypothetical protein
MCYTVPQKAEPVQLKAKVWTKRGLIFLGVLVRQSREALKISLDGASDLIFDRTGERISKKTIGNVENSSGMPTWNTFAVISAARMVTNPENGKFLDEQDFLNIASEFYRPKIMELAKMIDLAIALNNLDKSQVYNKSQILRLGEMSRERFDAILEGSQTVTDDEVRIIRELVDPDEQAFSETEWLEAAGLIEQ